MIEECRSDDIQECIRVFDRSPHKEWPVKVKNVVLAGRPFLRMPFVVDDIERQTYKKDGESPVIWFLCFGSVRDQRDVLLYEVLPFLVEMDAEGGDILWCPSTEEVESADYRQDALEILDACEKLEEFNMEYGTKFRIGLAKLWLPVGKEYERERVYCCRLGAALDVIGFHYIQCRVLALGVFTTTDDPQKGGEVVDVQFQGDVRFREDSYLDKSGYRLRDYVYRTVRQRIRKLLGDEGVEPEDWSKSRAAGFIRAPGDTRATGFKIFDPPRGSPMKSLIKERARIRVEFSKDRLARKDLPQLGPIKFGQFNYTSKNVKPQDLSRTAKTTLGNGVRESILPLTYTSFPEEAMTRSAQERGHLRHLKLVKIPKPVITHQGEKRQVTTLQGSKIQAMKTNIPARDLVNKDWQEKELKELVKLQKEELKMLAEPTTLSSAVRTLNQTNAGRMMSAQQRLKSRTAAVLDRSDSSVEFLGEVQGDPEKERREKPVVRSTPPMMSDVSTSQVATPRQAVALPSAMLQAADVSVDVLELDGDRDDPDRDRIIMQRVRVRIEMERLAKYESEYAAKIENLRWKR